MSVCVCVIHHHVWQIAIQPNIRQHCFGIDGKNIPMRPVNIRLILILYQLQYQFPIPKSPITVVIPQLQIIIYWGILNWSKLMHFVVPVSDYNI